MITLPSSRADSFDLAAGAARGEVVLDLGVDDLVDRAEVGGDAGRSSRAMRRQEVHVRARTSDRRRGRGRSWKISGVSLLAVAVDPADPLLQPGRVERDVEVHQPVAVGLQVDALAGGVGGDQDPDRLLVRVGAVNCARMSSRSSAGVEPWITASSVPSR